MSFYNLKTQNDGTYLISKFTDDLEVESFYSMIIMDGTLNCTCPAGARPKCRHREMFHDLLPKADTNWLFDWDNEQWRQYIGPLGEIIDDETFNKAEAIAGNNGTISSSGGAGGSVEAIARDEQIARLSGDEHYANPNDGYIPFGKGSATSSPASVADPASGGGAITHPATSPLANFKRRV